MGLFSQNSVKKKENLKNAKNEVETQILQGFTAHFASFVTFPENPLPESVSTLLFEKWVRLVKLPKLGSFGKIEQVGAIHELPQKKSVKNQTKTQALQGFPAHFASFVTFSKNPLSEGVVGVRFIEPEKWVRLVKLVTRKRLSFRAKRGIPKLLAKGIPRFARNDRLIIKKSTKNQAKTQSLQGFPAHFASFVTFSANPLSKSVSTLLFEKWVRLVKIAKTGSFGKNFKQLENLQRENAKNKAKTQALQGFPAQFASFVTFPANPLPESVLVLLLEKWVRLVKMPKLSSFGKNFKQLKNPQRENAKNKAKTQAPQGFPAQFASFVTFSENPLPESEIASFSEK